jgi:hypothetical protein
MSHLELSIRRVGVAAISAALAFAAGCADTGSVRENPRPGQPVAQSSSSGCNTGAAVAVGALAGALLGKGKGHLVGAAVGAGIGALACTAYNYRSRQVRDTRTVEAEYVQKRGALPVANTVQTYESSLKPANAVQAGQPVALQSRIVVVNGTGAQAPRLTETLVLISPEGKEVSNVTKPASAISGTGEYQTDFSFNLPKGIETGRYTVKSTLTMDGKTVDTNTMPMLVVS